MNNKVSLNYHKMGKCVFENSLTFFNAYIVKIWNSLKETYAYLLKNFVNSFCKRNFEYENLMLILEKPIMEYDCPIFSLVLFSERKRVQKLEYISASFPWPSVLALNELQTKLCILALP